jgi:hypothetical protein
VAFLVEKFEIEKYNKSGAAYGRPAFVVFFNYF